MLVVIKLFNIAVNDFNAQEFARCRRVLVVTELVVSGAQCIVAKCCARNILVVTETGCGLVRRCEKHAIVSLSEATADFLKFCCWIEEQLLNQE